MLGVNVVSLVRLINVCMFQRAPSQAQKECNDIDRVWMGKREWLRFGVRDEVLEMRCSWCMGNDERPELKHGRLRRSCGANQGCG